MRSNYDDAQRQLDIMNVNELSVKDEDCKKVLAEAARKVRLIAARKNIRYSKPLSEIYSNKLQCQQI
jgi:hypothetical protein